VRFEDQEDRGMTGEDPKSIVLSVHFRLLTRRSEWGWVEQILTRTIVKGIPVRREIAEL